MKITDVKAVFPNYKHVVPSWRTHFWQVVVRVESDSGVAGFGYGGGGIASLRIDPQGKAFAQQLLDFPVPVSADILETLQ